MLAQPPVWLVAIAFLAALGPLIVGHELGHYWVARWFGVGAEAFSIGFGKEVAGWTDKRGTRWKIGLLPLGGYVKFIGDDDPTSTTKASDDIAPALRGQSFHLRPAWQRFLIVLAGPATNFIIAILIFAAFFALVGMPRTATIVSDVRPGSSAQIAGIKAGDRITTMAGRTINSFEELADFVALRPAEKVAIQIDRGGQSMAFSATFDTVEQADRFGNQFRIGQLGVLGSKRVAVDVPPLQLIPEAVVATVKTTRSMADGLWQIVSGRRSIKDLGGPLRMAQIAGQQASLGTYEFISLIAIFSINLGFINLLPIPMLDGGHLVLYSIEAIRRRPASERVVEWAFRGGLAFLLALLLVATFNDLGFFGLWDGVGRLIG
ncbi:RIP metalloprotease RseP [Sphingomonas sp.]|uniref:RIP metalloprotease RseP n=1 Tax=Sphingomonas sp. TaxID=28214 RepID=UPI00286B5270|nr:RIP metalloprotease RseP [Sphingomonas sp.]